LTNATRSHIMMRVTCIMTNILNKHDCKIELNEHSLRATPARVALMKLFESVEEPIDVQTMIDFLDKKEITTDNATVFRIVNMFAEKGLIKKVELHEGKFRYELSSKPEHHHLTCQKCGTIQDISDCNIEALESDIEKRKGFKVTSHALEFFGICSNCQK